MDLTNKELHFIGYISTVQTSLKRADALMALAERNAEDAKTLAACTAIVLAAALEQGIQTKLTESAELTSFEEDIDISDSKAVPFYKSSPWHKVKNLPSILTDDKFCLDVDHRLSKLLKELIVTRNKLVHIDEQAIHLTSSSNQVRIENNHAVVEFFVPLSIWETITLEKVKDFREAVTVYFREVLFPESGNITEGVIIITES
jgi:hypothetical protein